MCGLFGWIMDPKKGKLDVLPDLTRYLAIQSQQRGDDSMGIAFMREGDEAPTVLKDKGPATMVLRAIEKDLAPAFTPGTLWLMGHTRSATIGPPNQENAHPFVMGKTVGAHNGHITNHAALPIDKDRYKLPECDSAALIAMMDQEGPVNALAQAFGTINLCFSQAPWKEITIYKEYAMGLHLAYIPAWGLVCWASEEDYLRLALAFLDAPMGEHEGHIVEMPHEKLCPLSISGLSKPILHWAGEPTDAPTKRWPVQHYGAYRCNVPDNEYWNAWKEDRQQQSSTRSRPKGPAHRSVISDDWWHRGRQDECNTCKHMDMTMVQWIVYRQRDRITGVNQWGPSGGMPHKCLNCQRLAVMDVASGGYHCQLCGAWMARVYGGKLPACPVNLSNVVPLRQLTHQHNGGLHA